MKISRRDAFKSASFALGGVAVETAFSRGALGQRPPEHAGAQPLPPAFASLKPLGDRVKPIRAEEMQARIARAQQLMTDAMPRFEALYVTPGTTLVYYTGIRWWPSERILALLIPRQGDPPRLPGVRRGPLARIDALADRTSRLAGRRKPVHDY